MLAYPSVGKFVVFIVYLYMYDEKCVREPELYAILDFMCRLVYLAFPCVI